jgi:predicted RNA-binding protein (virulence factor B family)
VNEDIEVGKINQLKVKRKSENGLYLIAENEQEVLLPNRYVKDNISIEDIINVFIYTDSEDRLVASTIYPDAMVDEFGYFEVVGNKHYGSFVKWGLPKDLFVPLSQQKSHFEIGKKYILRVCLDTKTNRLYGSQRIGKYLSYKPQKLPKNQKLKGLIISKTPMGYKVIVENKYEGMIFNNEIFQNISIGETINLYLKNIRSDGKLDLLLQPMGQKATITLFEKKLLEILKKQNGFIPLNSKSDADKIQNTFGMSKKRFKSALNSLLEQNKIKFYENGIKII